MSEKETLKVVGKVEGWYALEKGTYIKIYGATKAPHLFPKFILDKLVLKEVSYHMLVWSWGNPGPR